MHRRVDDNRKIEAPGHSEHGAECFLLVLRACFGVVVVETDLSNGNHFRISGKLLEFVKSCSFNSAVGIMRMQADIGMDEAVFPGKIN